MNRWHSLARYCLALLGMAIFGVSVSTGPARAEVTRVVVEASGVMGSFGGREYVWVTAAMEGTVRRENGEFGRYRVPISLMYPDRDPNGFGFVDIVNSADFEVYAEQDAPFGRRKIYYAGDIIFSDYLRREGYVYMSVQWARMVTDVLGADYGIIENGKDANEIVKDAARFLRNPDKIKGDLPLRPNAVDRVIGFGQSQTASLLLEFVRAGQNREDDGALVFDGVLAGVHAGCLLLTNDETPRPGPGPAIPSFEEFVHCDDPLPEDGKFISILSQSDLNAFQSYMTRHETPNFRQYELAGVAHIPPDVVGLKVIGATRQNPASFKPPFKAMLRNLVEWIVSDTAPPEPRYIEGRVDADGHMHIATDADGNAKGGVRLPHMPTVLPSGEQVGAPLGVYTGLDPDYLDSPNLYPWIGGTFKPFSKQELAARYPSREVYVARVEKAAAALLADRFILQEDYEAYVRSAKHGW